MERYSPRTPVTSWEIKNTLKAKMVAGQRPAFQHADASRLMRDKGWKTPTKEAFPFDFTVWHSSISPQPGGLHHGDGGISRRPRFSYGPCGICWDIALKTEDRKKRLNVSGQASQLAREAPAIHSATLSCHVGPLMMRDVISCCLTVGSGEETWRRLRLNPVISR